MIDISKTHTETNTEKIFNTDTIYTVFRKKTPTYIFNYNCGISWSIFIIFVPLEREINTLQYIYLQS